MENNFKWAKMAVLVPRKYPDFAHIHLLSLKYSQYKASR
jgi:hypothetical protein